MPGRYSSDRWLTKPPYDIAIDWGLAGPLGLCVSYPFMDEKLVPTEYAMLNQHFSDGPVPGMATNPEAVRYDSGDGPGPNARGFLSNDPSAPLSPRLCTVAWGQIAGSLDPPTSTTVIDLRDGVNTYYIMAPRNNTVSANIRIDWPGLGPPNQLDVAARADLINRRVDFLYSVSQTVAPAADRMTIWDDGIRIGTLSPLPFALPATFGDVRVNGLAFGGGTSYVGQVLYAHFFRRYWNENDDSFAREIRANPYFFFARDKHASYSYAA